jgi:hypothetical protein
MSIVAQDISSSHELLARVRHKRKMIQAPMCSRRVQSKGKIVVKGSHREERSHLGLGTIEDDVRTLVKAQVLLEELGADSNIAGTQIDMVEPAQHRGPCTFEDLGFRHVRVGRADGYSWESPPFSRSYLTFYSQDGTALLL